MKKGEEHLAIHTSGSYTGAEPLSSYGYVIERKGSTIREDYGILEKGEDATHNSAEYMTPVKALEWLMDSEYRPEKVEILTGSELLVKQMKGEWGVNSDDLKDVHDRLTEMVEVLEEGHDISVSFKKVNKGTNRRASELSQLAIEDQVKLKKIQGKDKKRCPECGEELVVREGKHGKFYGCKGYPDCSYTEDIDG